jgi:hypothetical protein
MRTLLTALLTTYMRLNTFGVMAAWLGKRPLCLKATDCTENAVL